MFPLYASHGMKQPSILSAYFSGKLLRIYRQGKEGVSITSFIKSMVNRSSRCATTLMLPHCSAEEALEYDAKQ